MTRITRIASIALLVSCLRAGTDFFESKVRPILAANCTACHGPQTHMGGLDFTSPAGLIAARGRIAGVISYSARIKMPPSGKLKDADVRVIQQWLDSGGDVPQSTAPPAPAAAKTLWLTIPPRSVSPPANGPRNPIDRFLLARLNQQHLEPAPPASRLILLRRATFDLTGLPTEAETRAFLNDHTPDAFATLIDRLLASPRYAEKYARHWLDVARYADSTGTDEDHRYPHAWRYRDYVIDAFQRDLPYHQFIREQIAGDLIPSEPPSPRNTRGIIATGFLALGPKLLAEEDHTKIIYDIVDEQIEVVSRGVLGLTIACARCHDHKTDPITTKDYYALASIFASTKQVGDMSERVIKLHTVPLADASQWQEHQKKVTAKQQEITRARDKVSTARVASLRGRLAQYMIAAHRVYSAGEDAVAVAERESLDALALRQFVAYLKPDGERKPHLEAWHNAARDTAPVVAQAYQRQFESTLRQRTDAQEAWRRASDAAKQTGQAPPEMPRFFAGDDRFFTEVNSSTTGPFALPKEDNLAAPLIPSETHAQIVKLKAELAALQAAAPSQPPMACAVSEGEPVDQRVFIRGNHEVKGDAVPKRFPEVLAGRSQPGVTNGSGRLELANWLASPDNPLTARVIVNRVWYWHFGEGLVRTPSNFGFTGEPPTHPELLDWLATEFVSNGWSLKKLHRVMMLSDAYQRSSQPAKAHLTHDPENRLLTRFARRRLQAEEIRDSLLALDASLDLTMGGTLQTGEGTDDFSTKRLGISPDDSVRRTVYLPLRRSNVPPSLMLFDFGDATTTMESRAQTNIAPQALYMMNSPFVASRALTIANRLLQTSGADSDRLRAAWALILNKQPSANDIDEGLTYLKRYPGGAPQQQAWKSYVRALLASNDFLYVQ